MNESVHVKHVTSSRCGDPDDSANQSTLGEEDPGAAVVCTHTPATKSPDRTLQLRKALSRWENEGEPMATRRPTRQIWSLVEQK